MTGLTIDDSMDNPIARFERCWLAPYAMHSVESAGRHHPETGHAYRGPFQRDRDRILHSAAFRRLSGKTQVFTGSMGDYHRTRLTHTMEVASIARTIGRALRLNEDLIEALALLHDIGHPPFGHAGEEALDGCLAQHGGFSHNAFALTLVCELETPYPSFPGLNLTREVLECQWARAEKENQTVPLLEAQVVDLADSITYDAHDVDDAVQLNLLALDELLEVPLPRECVERVRERFGDLRAAMQRRALVHELIDVQVCDLVATSQVTLAAAQLSSAREAQAKELRLGATAELNQKKQQLEEFLYQRVYRHEQLAAVRRDAQQRLQATFGHLIDHHDLLPPDVQRRIDHVGPHRAVADYLAAMTDQFFQRQFQRTSRASAAPSPSSTRLDWG